MAHSFLAACREERGCSAKVVHVKHDSTKMAGSMALHFVHPSLNLVHVSPISPLRRYFPANAKALSIGCGQEGHVGDGATWLMGGIKVNAFDVSCTTWIDGRFNV